MSIEESVFTEKKARSLSTLREKSQLANKPCHQHLGSIHPPLLNIELTKVVVDELHLLLRVMDVWRTHIAFLSIPFCNCRHVYTLMYLGSDHVNLCIVTNTSTTDCDFMFTPGLFLDMFLYF